MRGCLAVFLLQALNVPLEGKMVPACDKQLWHQDLCNDDLQFTHTAVTVPVIFLMLCEMYLFVYSTVSLNVSLPQSYLSIQSSILSSLCLHPAPQGTMNNERQKKGQTEWDFSHKDTHKVEETDPVLWEATTDTWDSEQS